MSEKLLRIGILGASKIAPDSVINPSKNIRSIEVSGIAAGNSQKAKEYALKYGIPKAFDNYEELIENNNIDLVYISLKNDMHYEYAIKAINHKKHVLIEKPICLNTREYCEIESLAVKNKVVALEAMMVRHHPWQKEMHKIINERGYGRIIHIVSYNNFVLKDENDFRLISENGGGAIYDLGCYSLQFVQEMVGLDLVLESCTANTYGQNDVDIDFTAQFVSKNQVTVEINGSFVKPFKAHHIVECEKGIVEVRNFFRPGFGFNKLHIHSTDKLTGSTDSVSFPPMNYYHNQLIYILAATETGNYLELLRSSGERVRLMERLHQSKKGTVVSSYPVNMAFGI